MAKRGRKPNPEALRRRTSVTFKAPLRLEEKVDRMMKERGLTSRADLLRRLIDEAPDPGSKSGSGDNGNSRQVRSGGGAKRAQAAAKRLQAMGQVIELFPATGRQLELLPRVA